MAMIAIMLARYWKPLALAALIAAAIGYRAILIHQRDVARRQASAAEAAVAGLRLENQSLARQVQDQNAAVEAIRRAADEQAQAMGVRMRDAERTAQAAASRGQADAQAIARVPIAAGCEEAMRWGRARAKELGRW